MRCLLRSLMDAHNSRVAAGGPGKRLTMKVLAEDTGIAESTLSRLCKSTATRIDLNTADTLCRYLGVGMGDLFAVEGQADRPSGS